MAIFSFRHSYLGKSHEKYKPGVAQQHANYITRESACTKVLAKRAPVDRHAIKAWLSREEAADRKNARIVDKLMIALPVELSPAQRERLVKDFCERATQGRASWIAAIHDRGKDAHNPHVHIMLRDRDVETGKRVMMTTERGSTERLRQQWEEVTNNGLERAGLDIRIDRRTLEAQRIGRQAGVHKGPRSKPEVPVEVATSANPFDRERADRRRTKQRSGVNAQEPEWTSRGGMVAQQWSATKWAKRTSAKRPNPFDKPRQRSEQDREREVLSGAERQSPGGISR